MSQMTASLDWLHYYGEKAKAHNALPMSKALKLKEIVNPVQSAALLTLYQKIRNEDELAAARMFPDISIIQSDARETEVPALYKQAVNAAVRENMAYRMLLFLGFTCDDAIRIAKGGARVEH